MGWKRCLQFSKRILIKRNKADNNYKKLSKIIPLGDEDRRALGMIIGPLEFLMSVTFNMIQVPIRSAEIHHPNN
jgi:hypothetical protein